MTDQFQLIEAIQDFRQARRQAAMEEVLARIKGRSAQLFSYEDVRQKFKLGTGSSRGVQEIPLDAIVGSVGRYIDFTRSFLPRQESDKHRWTGVALAMNDLSGLPPIEVYQVGQVYFVLDGNHRVSVARQLGADYIEAYVTEFKTKVPPTPQDQPDDLIIKAEYANFLEKTRLDELRPQADLQATVPGRYWELLTEIEAQHHFLKQEQAQDVPYTEAVTHWYDHVYLPVIRKIRELGLLRDFPDRTETDLYLWILRHRSELEKKLGWQITPEAAAANLSAEHSPRSSRLVARVEEKLSDALIPDQLEGGPPPGQWRRERQAAELQERLFVHILVPLSGRASDWEALEQAFTIARQDDSHLYGLHILPTADQAESEAAKAVQAEFNRRCQAAGIPGELSIETGPISRIMCHRARWVDLIVVRLNHPPGSSPLARLGSGTRAIIQRCSRPMLMVPGPASPIKRLLLAYDDSPKAKEGLYIATYLAGCWQSSLVVLTVTDKPGSAARLEPARQYLAQRGIEATLLATGSKVAPTILETAAKYEADTIIMGGYGLNPMLGMVLGSSVDQVLRQSEKPLLICR